MLVLASIDLAYVRHTTDSCVSGQFIVMRRRGCPKAMLVGQLVTMTWSIDRGTSPVQTGAKLCPAGPTLEQTAQLPAQHVSRHVLQCHFALLALVDILRYL
jgi:hypothetical protein